MKIRHTLCFMLLACSLFAQPKLQMQTYVSGFSRPVDIVNAGDERLFVVEQNGFIRIIDTNDQVLPTPFLNIDPRVNSASNERGLLGLAFHPNYAQNGYFYVNYTNNSGHTHISRFSVNPNDANLADPDSEKILLVVNQPYSNHNAGDLNFGPDGYLYFGLGDGGAGGDPQNYGQNRQSFLGKMIRIDVDNGDPYAVPPTNPFVGSTNTLPEIWAIGMRNPWRFSFDRLTGDLWIGDVGQDDWEEIDFEPAGSAGGLNYGWRCYEGLNTYNTSGCGPESDYTKPIHVYANNFTVGCSVTGGFVYRGSQYPDLYGHYVYADYCSGRVWSIVPNAAGGWTNTQLFQGPAQQYSSFGEDINGELYVAGLASGIIYRVVELCSPFMVAATFSNITCPGASDGTIQLIINNNTASYEVAWTGGNELSGENLGNLPAGDYTATVTNNIGCARNVSITINEPQAPELLLSQADGLISATAGFPAYTWLLNGAPLTSTVENTFQATESGEYTVQVTTPNGCTYLSEPIVVMITRVTEAEMGFQRLSVSPNPFRSQLKLAIELKEAASYRIRILDTQGATVYQNQEWIYPGFKKNLSLEDLPSGLYLLCISKDGKELVRKIQKG